MAAERAAVVMAVWLVLAPFVWFRAEGVAHLWPVYLWIALTASSIIGMLFTAGMGLQPCPFIDWIIFAKRPAWKVSTYTLAVLGVITAQFLATKFRILADSGSIMNPFGRVPRKLIFDLAEGAIQEEIFFRLFLLPSFLIISSRMLPARLAKQGFIIANVTQAFIYGGLHMIENAYIMRSPVSCTRILTTVQTWEGLLLGYIFKCLGTEAVIVSHALADILLVFSP